MSVSLFVLPPSEPSCAFHSACMQILLGLVQFGFVVTYLSEPLVRGYTTGAAIHVIVSQLKYTFGINPKRYSGPCSLIFVRKNTATVTYRCSLPHILLKLMIITNA